MERSWGVLAAAFAATAVTGVSGVGAPAPASAEAVMTVTPSSDLIDGDAVEVTVTGLEAGGWVDIAQCAPDAVDFYQDCDYADVQWANADGEGTATTTLRVDAIVARGYPGSAEQQDVDCRADACTIGATTSAGSLTTVPIAFDADAPLAPPPTLAVTPDAALTDGQTVAVALSGFVWSTRAVLTQCAADVLVEGGPCGDWQQTQVDVDADGAATAEIPVHAVIDSWEGGGIDCRAPGACVLVATNGSLVDGKAATAALAFDPDAEVRVPDIALDPSDGLVDGQRITVSGSGAAGGWVEIYECAGEPSFDTCRHVGWAEVTDAGTFAAEVSVWAAFPTSGDTADCRTGAEACRIVATPTLPGSLRAGAADLGFDPDGPLLPPPAIEVTPASGVDDGAQVAVDGTNFTADDVVGVTLCRDDDTGMCDEASAVYEQASADGDLTVTMTVESQFVAWGTEAVDCREAPGCVMRAEDWTRGLTASAPITFAPLPEDGQRYLDPVFDDVEITADIVYGTVAGSGGAAVDLTLDLYEPAGDSAERRPVIVWGAGGWFGPDHSGTGESFAGEYARRGYVVALVHVRTDPDLHCCPTRDAVGLAGAVADATEDLGTAVRWVHDHAADHDLDPAAVVVGGAQGGATAAFGVAYPGQDRGRPATDPADRDGTGGEGDVGPVAAAVPVGGTAVGEPAAGAPPVLAFNSTSGLAPAFLSEWTCASAARAGDECDVVSYTSAGDVAVGHTRSVVNTSTAFIADAVLSPLGYVDGDDPDAPPTTMPDPRRPGDGGGGAGVTTGVPAGQDAPPRDGARATGDLARTGANSTLWLVGVGLAAVAAGSALVAVARLRRRSRGAAEGGAVITVVVLGLALAAPAWLGATSAADAQEPVGDDPPVEDTTTSVADTPTSSADPTTTTADTTTTEDTTTTSENTTTTTDGVSVGEQPTAPSAPAGDGAGGPGDQDASADFPDDWTAEQVAFAENLIAETEAAIEARYLNPGLLPLLGFAWIGDGTRSEYGHWVNLGWLYDGHVLDPEYPESLVFRVTDDGPVIEAAMYLLPPGYTLDTIPEDIAWLPGWHVHDNICWDGTQVVDLIEPGETECERGTILPTPPMVHVWIVDTACGRFAGVDENGLICHDHDH